MTPPSPQLYTLTVCQLLTRLCLFLGETSEMQERINLNIEKISVVIYFILVYNF